MQVIQITEKENVDLELLKRTAFTNLKTVIPVFLMAIACDRICSESAKSAVLVHRVRNKNNRHVKEIVSIIKCS